MERKVKLQKQTTAGTVSMTLPKPFCELLNWTVGEVVETKLDLDKKCVIVKKAQNEVIYTYSDINNSVFDSLNSGLSTTYICE